MAGFRWREPAPAGCRLVRAAWAGGTSMALPDLGVVTGQQEVLEDPRLALIELVHVGSGVLQNKFAGAVLVEVEYARSPAVVVGEPDEQRWSGEFFGR